MRSDKTTYRWAKVHVKAFTGSAAVIDDVISPGVYTVRVAVSNGAHVVVSGTATAATTDTPLGSPGNSGVEYMDVRPGEKISAIGQSGVTSGTLYVTECTS